MCLNAKEIWVPCGHEAICPINSVVPFGTLNYGRFLLKFEKSAKSGKTGACCVESVRVPSDEEIWHVIFIGGSITAFLCCPMNFFENNSSKTLGIVIFLNEN